MKTSFKILVIFCLGLMMSCTEKTSSTKSNVVESPSQKDSLLQWLHTHQPIDTAYRNTLLKAVASSSDIFSKEHKLAEAVIQYSEFLIRKNKADTVFYSMMLTQSGGPMADKYKQAVYNNLGMMVQKRGLQDSASVFLNKAIKAYQTVPNDSLMEQSYIGMGQVHYNKADYEKALDYYKKALEKAQKLKDNGNTINTNMHIASVYMDLNDNKKAIEYFSEAAIAFQKEKNFAKAVTTYSSIAGCYSNLKDTVNSFKASDKALSLLDSTNGDEYSKFAALISRGTTLQRFKFYKESIPYFDKSIKVIEGLNNIYYANRTRLFKVASLIKLKQYEGARKELMILLDFAKKMKDDPSFIVDIYGQLALVENGLGNYKASLDYTSKYYGKKDTINIKDKALKIAEIEKKYESTQKDLTLQLQKQQLLSAKQQNNNLTLSAILIGVLALGALYFLNNYRKKIAIRKEALLKDKYSQDLITATENEQSRIALDLHDGVASELLVLKSNLKSDLNKDSGKKIDAIIEEIRMLTKKLYPVQLSKVGLGTSIVGLINALDKENDLFFSHEIDESLNNALDSEKQLYVYRIVQEALANVIKHANAQAVFIKLERVDNTMELLIKDNGSGFDKGLIEKEERYKLGLSSMQHRASFINGSIDIQSEKGEGTSILLKIPITQ